MLTPAPFRIEVSDEELDGLRTRLRATRWPDDAPDEPWLQGTDLHFLRDLTDYWDRSFDWRTAEADLNRRHQFTAVIEGTRIHFVHERARSGTGIPLILTHGWPSAFIEYLPVLDILVDPHGAGLDGPAFDIVLPSLPGYAFSERPREIGVNYRRVARLWHELMNGLGYMNAMARAVATLVRELHRLSRSTSRTRSSVSTSLISSCRTARRSSTR